MTDREILDHFEQWLNAQMDWHYEEWRKGFIWDDVQAQAESFKEALDKLRELREKADDV